MIHIMLTLAVGAAAFDGPADGSEDGACASADTDSVHANFAVAKELFDIIESGLGAGAIADYVDDTNTFTIQAVDALDGPAVSECADMNCYADWMAGVVNHFGEAATYEVHSSGYDDDNNIALFFATFGGFSHYVYAFAFTENGKVSTMTKVWNDEYAARILAGAGPAAATELGPQGGNGGHDALGRLTIATQLFNGIETGQGWEAVKAYCTDDASFSVQAVDALDVPAVSECTDLQCYADWMGGIVDAFGDAATYDLHASVYDAASDSSLFYATFGGFSHYVYAFAFAEDGKVSSMTKIWNDAAALAIMSAPK